MMKPVIMGAAMAAMMLWMLHDQIMSGGVSLSWGALAFVLAHVAVVAAGASLGLLFPRFQQMLRHHRPTLRHMAAMAAGAVVMAGGIHIVLHGVV